MSRYGYNQLDVMRESGVSNSVLCLWLQRKYKGDNAKVATRLAAWMADIEQRKRAIGNSAVAAAASPSTAAAATSTAATAARHSSSSAAASLGSKHSQRQMHQHIVPIRLAHSLTHPAQPHSTAHSGTAAATDAAPNTTNGHDSGRQSFSDCFLFNLFDKQSPQLFLRQRLAQRGLDPATWLAPLLLQMKSQLAYFVATEPQRSEDLNEWPALVQLYGLPAASTSAAATTAAPTAAAMNAAPMSAAAAAANASLSSSADAAASATAGDHSSRAGTFAQVPSALQVPGLVGQGAGGTGVQPMQLPTFVCGAVSSMPPRAAFDPSNNMRPRPARASVRHAFTDIPDPDPATDAAAPGFAPATAAPAAPRPVDLHPDISLLQQDPSGRSDISRHSAPQLLKIRLDVVAGRTRFVHHVLWDGDNPHCVPEDYSRCISTETGLGEDFAALIAWQLRERLRADAALLASGQVEGSLPRVPFPLAGEDLFRDEMAAADFGPHITAMGAEEAEKALQEQARSISPSALLPVRDLPALPADDCCDDGDGSGNGNGATNPALFSRPDPATTAAATTATSIQGHKRKKKQSSRASSIQESSGSNSTPSPTAPGQERKRRHVSMNAAHAAAMAASGLGPSLSLAAPPLPFASSSLAWSSSRPGSGAGAAAAPVPMLPPSFLMQHQPHTLFHSAAAAAAPHLQTQYWNVNGLATPPSFMHSAPMQQQQQQQMHQQQQPQQPRHVMHAFPPPPPTPPAPQ